MRRSRGGMRGWVAVLAACGSVAAARANLLENPGFETGDSTNWVSFGVNWRASSWAAGDLKDFAEGGWGLVNDVRPEDPPSEEWRGVGQTLPAKAGGKYSAAVWIRAFQVESSESYLEILFLDKEGEVLEVFQSVHVTEDQPFARVRIDKVKAPPGTESARVQGVVHMLAAPTESLDYHIFDGFELDRSQKVQSED